MEQICKKIPKLQMGDIITPFSKKKSQPPRQRFKEIPAMADLPKKRHKMLPISHMQTGGRATPGRPAQFAHFNVPVGEDGKKLKKKLIAKKQEGGSLLGKILSYYPGTAIQMAIAKKVGKNLSENLYPATYAKPIKRVISAGILNRPGYDEAALPSEERRDLLSMLFNQKQKYNTIKKADYSPSISKENNGKYFKSEETEDNIRNLLSTSINSNKEQDVRKVLTGFGAFGATSASLGNAKLDYGKDDKGSYVSYYDKWDLNPIPSTNIDAVDKIVDKVVTGIPQALGLTTTPEVYGRIYLNSQGRPINNQQASLIPKHK